MATCRLGKSSGPEAAEMDEARRRRVEELFQGVVDLPPEQRSAYLDAHCRAEAPVRSEVERLLGHLEHGQITSLRVIDQADAAEADPTGTRVGPYKLLELIGEGGFGSVYMAEQCEPIRRRVALKIIKLGMDTRQVIARFEAERQALAMMDHPNIARVFEAGATETGRPYFAMELVRGIPITTYCDEHRLPVRQRLELFTQVARAVQHAHQKGIIHRDLKPSNVLVTLHDGTPVPKIIDFGIAKATREPLTDKTLFTAFRQFIGTPEYMSPEQAEMSGLGIDTRSDIYSLGVLLYELLTGTTPFDSRSLRGAACGEIQRIIREQDPPTPSRRVSTLGAALHAVARSRQVEPRALNKLVRGDLDWIVMKALEKDRTRRYESASDLATDIVRHLSGEPVAAGPPSAAYKFRKLVVRHKTAFAFVAALFALVAGFSVWMAFLYAEAHRLQGESELARHVAEINLGRAREAEALAQSEADSAREVVEFLVELFEVADPVGAKGQGITAREILDAGASQIKSELNDRPETQATLLHTVGRVYHNLGLFDRAVPLLQDAVETRRTLLGPEHPDTLAALNSLGWALMADGRLSEAESLLRATLQTARTTLGDDHRETLAALSGLAWTLQHTGRLAEAEPLFREALAGRRRTLGNDHPRTLSSLNALSWLLQRLGNVAEAEALGREALETSRRIHGEEHASTAESMNVLGTLLLRRREFSEAEPLLRGAEAIRLRVLGDEHPSTIESMDGVAWLLWQQGRLAEAEEQYRRTLERYRHALGDQDPRTLRCMNQLGGVLVDRGKPADAAATLHDAAVGLRRALGAEHPQALHGLINWCEVLFLQGNLAEGAPWLREARDYLQRTPSGAPELARRVTMLLAIALQDQGQATEAEALLRECLAAARESSPDDPARLALPQSFLGACLTMQRRYEEAEPLLLESYPAIRAQRGEAHRLTLRALEHVVQLYEAWGKPEQAALWRARYPATPPADIRQTHSVPLDE